MPKHKAHKGLGKRVKITASGKVKYHRCGCSHLMKSKNAKRRRRLSGTAILNKTLSHKVIFKLS